MVRSAKNESATQESATLRRSVNRATECSLHDSQLPRWVHPEVSRIKEDEEEKTGEKEAKNNSTGLGDFELDPQFIRTSMTWGTWRKPVDGSYPLDDDSQLIWVRDRRHYLRRATYHHNKCITDIWQRMVLEIMAWILNSSNIPNNSQDSLRHPKCYQVRQ